MDPGLFFFFFVCFLLIIFGFLQAEGINRVVEECSGRLPLHIAADFGQLAVMEYLIKTGADVNVSASSPVVLLGVTLMGNWFSQDLAQCFHELH